MEELKNEVLDTKMTAKPIAMFPPKHIYSKEEQDYLAEYDYQWPDVSKGEGLRRRVQTFQLITAIVNGFLGIKGAAEIRHKPPLNNKELDFLTQYEEEWPEVVKGEALRQRAEQERLINCMVNGFRRSHGKRDRKPQPLFSAEEQEFLTVYEEEWPDTCKSEALKRRGEYQKLIVLIEEEIQQIFSGINVEEFDENNERENTGDETLETAFQMTKDNGAEDTSVDSYGPAETKAREAADVADSMAFKADEARGIANRQLDVTIDAASAAFTFSMAAATAPDSVASESQAELARSSAQLAAEAAVGAIEAADSAASHAKTARSSADKVAALGPGWAHIAQAAAKDAAIAEAAWEGAAAASMEATANSRRAAEAAAGASATADARKATAKSRMATEAHTKIAAAIMAEKAAREREQDAKRIRSAPTHEASPPSSSPTSGGMFGLGSIIGLAASVGREWWRNSRAIAEADGVIKNMTGFDPRGLRPDVYRAISEPIAERLKAGERLSNPDVTMLKLCSLYELSTAAEDEHHQAIFSKAVAKLRRIAGDDIGSGVSLNSYARVPLSD